MAKSQDNKKADEPKAKDDIKSAPKVIDVAKPGETAALPTSRPIISEHSPMLKIDPMVKSSDADGEGKAAQEKLTKKKPGITIMPPPADTSEEEPKTESKEPEPTDEAQPTDNNDQKDDESADKDGEPEPKKVDADDKKEDEYSQGDSSSDAGAVEALASKAELKKQTEKQAEEKEKQDAKVQELVTGKKYFVPITEGGRQASGQRFLTWILLLVILLAAGFVLAIDAGYLDIGVKLPFDLIKNN